MTLLWGFDKPPRPKLNQYESGLVGQRPRSIEELAPRAACPPLQPGTCYQCGANLRTSLDAALHRCDRYLTMKGRRMGERKARVRL